MDALRVAYGVAVEPRYAIYTVPLQWIADAVLCGLIVRRIPYTEIDWKAYMQQIEIYIAGERDYAKIYGDTGPLVYPAAHVYIYRLLYALTSGGTDIFTAQCIFIGLYLTTLLLVMQCYRKAGVPPYIFPLLSLSKRVHSIFMLRLFNDCFAVFFLWLAIWFYQRKLWTFGSLAYSFGLGVKMSLLLALPAIGLVLWQGMGRNRALYAAQSMGQLQVMLAFPFISSALKSYGTRAFEFTRTFLFKWTVNWRFLGEEVFLSRPFSLVLIGAHLVMLCAFGLSKWLIPANWSLPEAIDKLITPPPKEEEARIYCRVTPDFILSSILSALVIGCLCARSLHYQFFVYISWSVPFLLWRSKMHPVLIFGICMVEEWAWNVYPSTNASSLVVISCLAATIASAWIGTDACVSSHQSIDQKNHQHAE